MLKNGEMRGIYNWAKAGAKLEICNAEIFGLGRILDTSRMNSAAHWTLSTRREGISRTDMLMTENML